ncbi:beta-1,3-galactosyltransferase 4-like [Rhipicephalus sanguineus]|uniref:beta-1,3-galactosyltransferase 4-like n=1 Tax=Rhipicephalus sanguineus TaxID=34632 RepID=UPI0020C40762|nr:beta-1,3-galactosyltransferase 4-like [Rhipicephalus sanguineus]
MPLAMYEPDWLPSYIHGSGYVVSRDAVRPLFTEALTTPFLYVEDIFLTGIVAQKVGIELTHSRCFIPYSVWHPCDYRNFISTHEWDLQQLQVAWQSVHHAEHLCPPADESLLACSYARVLKKNTFLEPLLPQRDQTRIVVGPGRFPALPNLRCPEFLAIVVCSAVDHFEQRAVVRDTWARDAASGRSSVFFLIGFADNTPSGVILQERVADESARYGDIIQADFRDTYRNLTLKSVFLLKWAFMYCSRAQFLLKTDDDVFVNVPNMVHLLTALQSARRQTGCIARFPPAFFATNRVTWSRRPFVISNMRRNSTAERALGHKNYLPQSVFATDDLPLYGSGTAYVMSYDAVRPLFTEALLTPFLYVEDIFITGLVAQKVGIDKVHSECFVCCRVVHHACEYRTLVTAHLSKPERMRDVWSFVRNSSAVCPSPSERTPCWPYEPPAHTLTRQRR